MRRQIFSTTAAMILTSCASAPRPAPVAPSARTPSSAIEPRKPLVKRVGDKVQVIQTASAPDPGKDRPGVVMLDVMCPSDANGVVNGGCTVTDGPAPHRAGVLSGFYPLVSAEGGEGFRCLFDDAVKSDELTAMVFCKAPAPRKPRRLIQPATVATPAPGEAVPVPAGEVEPQRQ